MSETEAAPASNFVEEEWTYMGPSSTTTGAFVWRDGDGHRMVYKKFRARVFGGLHTIRVERVDSHTYVSGEPVYTGRQSEDAGQIQITALDVERRLRTKRLEANTSRTQTIDEAIAPLLELAGGIRSMSDRRALLDYITARVYTAKEN
jgi:hypothetical protein